MDNEELYHHGILGQKWGVRRYQNADGSLTAAGRRHLLKEETKNIKRQLKTEAKEEAKRIKIQSRMDAKIAKAQAKSQRKIDEAEAKAQEKIRKAAEKGAGIKPGKEPTPAPKSMNEMTNEALQAAINRKRLENQYKELNPQKEGRVKKLIKGMVDDAAMPAIIEGSKRGLTNVVQGWFQDKFGVDINKDGKVIGLKVKQAIESEPVKELAKEAANEAKKIKEGAAEKEAKKAEKQAEKETKKAAKEEKKTSKENEKAEKQAEKDAKKAEKDAAEEEARKAEEAAARQTMEANRLGNRFADATDYIDEVRNQSAETIIKNNDPSLGARVARMNEKIMNMSVDELDDYVDSGYRPKKLIFNK